MVPVLNPIHTLKLFKRHMAKYSYLRKRFRNVGLNAEDSSRLYNWFYRQIEGMGEARGIQYLKDCGDALLSYHYGTPRRPKWVRTYKGFPKCWLFLKKYPLELQVRLVKIARSILLSDVTEAQRIKVVEAVIQPFSGEDNYYDIVTSVLMDGINALGIKPNFKQPDCPDLVFRQFQQCSDSRVRPDVVSAVNNLSSNTRFQALPYWKESLLPLDVDAVPSEMISPGSPYVGRIYATQEGGGKLRMFAAPFKCYQVNLSPIHTWIAAFRDSLDTDCTLDQSKGALFARDQLREGRVVHSVDLSTATCRFPVSVQYYVLTALGLHGEFLDALSWACEGPWQVSEELVEFGFPSTLSWAVGQPLGIKPSMSMFSLTHNLLLTGICNRLGVNPSDTFRILGDDVVIVGDDVHSMYRSFMKVMGVPISEHKSHSSSKFAEFAGYSITRDFMVRPGKFAKASLSSHLSISDEHSSLLLGEVSLDMLLAEKLWLFRSEKYNPPNIEEYSRLLKANSNLTVDAFEYRLSCNHTLFVVGAKRLIADLYGPDPMLFTTFCGRIPDIREITSVIPNGLFRDQALSVTRWLQTLAPNNYAIFNTYVATLNSLWNLYVRGEIVSVDDALRLVRRVEAKTLDLFWIPPVKDLDSGLKIHKRIMNALLKTVA